MTCPGAGLHPHLLLLKVPHEEQGRVVLSRAGGDEGVGAVLQHGIRMVGVVLVPHRDTDHRLCLLEGIGQRPQRRDGAAEAGRDGIQHRHDVAQANPELLTCDALPRRTVAQPGEDPAERVEPARRGVEPVGDDPHPARVAGHRGQAGHHDPPNRLRDIPASVSR